MSTTIDERVVEMRFDNQQFERNVQTSMSTLDSLKQKLNLTGASKSLEDVNKAANHMNFSGLGNAVETVHAKFSALQVMGVTALANITNSAVNAGKKISSALTIDPIKTGFQEYETQINAVQTIMSNTRSKGTTLDDVNGALDELNTYADKTIYNFTEMTRNIGTFTAAGVDLDKSVTSIKGIANLAAVSGSTSQQASTAMYQLSQALAAGKVSLMDWNSVVNAGMGGQVFQDALKRTAENMGTNVDALIKKYGSFRESLTKGEWLTADVLTETLTQLSGAYSKADLIAKGYTEKQAEEIVALADDAESAATKVKTFTQLWDTLKESAQSGWTQSWEIIVGDFEEARSLLTKVSDTIGTMIGASAKARNDLLQGWKDGGGRTALIEALTNAFDGLMNVVKPIKEAFREIFPPLTAKQLIAFTEKLRDLTAKFKMSTEELEPLKSTFKGLFSIIDISVTFIKAIIGGIGDLLGGFTGLGNGILNVTGSFGDWLSGLRDTIKETDIFGETVNSIVKILQKAIDKIKEFVKFIKEKIALPGFEGFLDIMSNIWEVMQKIGGKIAEVASGIGNALANAFRSGDISSGLDILNGGILTGVLLTVKKFIGGLSDAFGDGGFLDSAKEILDGVKGSLEAYQQSLKADILMKIAGAIAILTAAIVVLSLIDPVKLSASLGAITVLFGDLMGSLAIFNRIDGNFVGVGKAITMMMGISISVLILASALKKISQLGWEELARGLVGIIGLTGTIVIAAKLMSKNGKKVVKGAGQMLIMAAALKVLASVCKDLSSLGWEELGKGLVGVGALMGAVSLFLRTAKFSGKSITTATGIVILAASMKILASVVKDFSGMNWEELGKGLAAIAGLLVEITAFTNLTGNAKHVVSTGLALVLIGASMKILASAVEDFSKMSWTEIGKGLTGMAGALVAVTLAMRFMPKNMIGIGTGLTIVTYALGMLTDTVMKMSGMSWTEIGKGLAALGGSLLILAIGLKAMNGSIAGSAALLVAAAALSVLTPVLTTLGDMSWINIAKSLVTIAGAFTIIGIAGLVLGPIIPNILALSGAIVLLGIGCLGVGAGISLIATGITLLTTSLTAGATAIVAALTVIVTGLAGLIPVVVAKIGEAIILFCEVIAQGAPALGEAIKAVILTLVDVLVECTPAIADGALKLISDILASLAQYTPQIVESIFQFLIALLYGIAANLPALIQSAVKVIMAFFQGITDALSGIDTTSLLKGIAGVGLLAVLMMALSAVASLIPGAMIGVIGMGLVVAELAIVLAAIGALAQIPGLEWLISEGGQFLQTIGTAIGQFIGGIVGGFATGATAGLPEVGTNLSNFMTNIQPFINGAKNIDAATMTGVKALAQTILLLTGADILEGLTSWLTGGSSLGNFGSQLGALATSLNAFTANLGTFDESKVATITCATKAIKVLAQAANALPNEGGLWAKIAGENSLATFGSQLGGLGTNLNSFVTNLGTFDESKVTTVTCAANAIKMLAQAAQGIPNEGGLWAKIAGDNSLATFGNKLPSLGTNLNTFATNLGTFNDAKVTTVTCAANAIKMLAQAANGIPNEDGWLGKIVGDNSIDTFGSKLASLGTNIKEFATNASGVSVEKMQTAVSALTALTKLSKIDMASAGDNMKAFGTNLVTFSKKLASFGTNMGSISDSSISTAISKTKELISLVKSLDGVDVSGAKAFANSLKTLGQNSVKNFTEAFTSGSTKAKVKNAATTLMLTFIVGAKLKQAAVKTAFTSIATNALSGVKNETNYTSFKNAGSYLVSGFCSGISANTYKAKAKASAMAAAAAAAAKKKLDIHSPSRVFYKIGDNTGRGFVNALDHYASIAYKSGSDMADSARIGLSNAISRITNIINNDIDAQPTIRPVLDLSAVESGAGAINGMFGQGLTLGASADIDTISSMMNSNIQNGGNAEVVSAINKLRKDLSNVGNTSYNISGITYDDGSNISEAVQSLVRAAKMERRI